MYSILAVSIISFVVCLVLTPLLRDALLRVGLVDEPDLVRKWHRCPTPRFGGVAIVLAYLTAFGALLLLPLKANDLIRPELPAVWTLMPAVGLIFMTGLADDLYGLRPRYKLLGQFGAAAGLTLGTACR